MILIIYSGGLGNQMFQYAFIKAAEISGRKLFSTTVWYSINNSHNGFELSKLFDIKLKRNVSIPFKLNKGKKQDKKQELKAVSESRITSIIRNKFLNNPFIKLREYNDAVYHPEVLDATGINIYSGYWQNEKYFKKYREYILKSFTFPTVLSTDTQNTDILKKIKETNSVSIHVRRGDYCNNPWYDGIATLDYYKLAIEYIKSKVEKPHFFIFSDDIEWCQKNLCFDKDYDFINWNKGNASYRDMQLMSLCKHNIIPNSSFSWWGAWLNLNNDKIVICPSKWINDCSGLDYSDIYPEEWIKL